MTYRGSGLKSKQILVEVKRLVDIVHTMKYLRRAASVGRLLMFKE